MPVRERRLAWLRRWYVPVTAAGLTLLAIIAVFRMESTAPDYDPQYMRVLVERTMRFGGSYYANGVHNKGPLEPLVYEIAGRVGGRDGWWFVISALTLVAAAAIGIAAAVVTIRTGGTVLLATSVAAMTIVHLTLSQSDYAGVLYARNMTTALLASAFAIAWYDPWWRDERTRRRSTVVVAACCGLAVQTLLTAAFTAAPVLLGAMWARRRERVGGRPVPMLLPPIAGAAMLSAPLGYRLFGPWDDFVAGYWTYARNMSAGTGRPLGDQLALGWERFGEYYADRWLVAAVLAVAGVATTVRWRRLTSTDAAVRVVVWAWWVGGWIEMVLSQRYSSHYFSIVAVPTIMIIATLVGDAGGAFRRVRRDRPSWAVLPLVVALVTVQVGEQRGLDTGIDAASVVDGTDDFTRRREAGIDGRTRMVRAALDLVSEERDPVLIWTSYPWPYLNLRRTSATRYIWKTFLLGEVYLGETGPEYVLPGTWEHFRDDVDRTDPTAYYVEAVNPIDPATPFREVVDERFTDVFVDDAVTLGLRDDLAAWLLEPRSDGVPIAPLGDGPATLAATGCTRIDSTIPRADGEAVTLVVDLVAPGPVRSSLRMTIDGTTALVESYHYGVAGHVTATEIGSGDVPVTIVVGARAAALVVDGRLAGAVEVAQGTSVTLADGAAELTANVAYRSELPDATGCGDVGA